MLNVKRKILIKKDILELVKKNYSFTHYDFILGMGYIYSEYIEEEIFEYIWYGQQDWFVIDYQGIRDGKYNLNRNGCERIELPIPKTLLGVSKYFDVEHSIDIIINIVFPMWYDKFCKIVTSYESGGLTFEELKKKYADLRNEDDFNTWYSEFVPSRHIDGCTYASSHAFDFHSYVFYKNIGDKWFYIIKGDHEKYLGDLYGDSIYFSSFYRYLRKAGSLQNAKWFFGVYIYQPLLEFLVKYINWEKLYGVDTFRYWDNLKTRSEKENRRRKTGKVSSRV
jgi:hypothetical protein